MAVLVTYLGSETFMLCDGRYMKSRTARPERTGQVGSHNNTLGIVWNKMAVSVKSGKWTTLVCPDHQQLMSLSFFQYIKVLACSLLMSCNYLAS